MQSKQQNRIRAVHCPADRAGMDALKKQINNLPVSQHGGGKHALLILCATKHEYWRIQSLTQRLKKLDNPGYAHVIKINGHNIIIIKEAPAPSVFDFWDVGEA